MADLRNTFAGITSPNPFWLASAPPTDKAYNIHRAFEAGWGGVVWKTLGEDGPPIVNVNGPRYGALLTPDRRLLGFNNIELITDRPLQLNLDEIRAVKRSWPERAVVVSLMVPCTESAWKAILPQGRGHRLRRHRAELRLPARHERTRHGRGRGPGAGVHPDGHGLVQAVQPAAGDREAHAQHHRHPPARARGQGRWGRCGVADQHHHLDHGRGPGDADDEPVHRRHGLARRLLRPGGQAHRAEHGGRRSGAIRPRPACRSVASAASAAGAMRWTTSPSAPATCRSAPRPWSTASRSCRR